MGHQVWIIAETFDPSIHPDLINLPVKVNHATSSSRGNSFYRNSQKALATLDPDAGPRCGFPDTLPRSEGVGPASKQPDFHVRSPGS
jgi:hypothetical protein